MAEIKARPTIYEGVQMRSRLEADFAAYLDRIGARWEYEPTCFASQGGQWLPDFQTAWDENQPYAVAAYTEVKSTHLLTRKRDEGSADAIARIDGYIRKATIAWETDPKAFLDVVFWKYGAEEPPANIYAYGEDRTWFVLGGSLPFAYLWPGMGQALAIKSTHSGFADVLNASPTGGDPWLA